MPEPRQPIACPTCGDTKWYALDNYSATDRVDFWTDGPAMRTDTENVSYHQKDFDGWYCDANEHPAPPELNEQLTELHAMVA